jgi:FkbM family methyltransferase
MSNQFFISFSSYGEDSLLNGLFSRLSNVNNIDLYSNKTYLDVGCYHPINSNNTYFLYQNGWRGTLVDPNPSIEQQVSEFRPNDYFLSNAADGTSGIKKFLMFNNESQSNTLDLVFADKIARSQDSNISYSIDVVCHTLDDLVNIHFNKFNEYPYVINIDVEGSDYDVVSNYSFNFRPKFFMIEDEILSAYTGSKIFDFMKSKNYFPVSSNFLTVIYMDMLDPIFKTIKKMGHLLIKEQEVNI